jgi:large exoprotein involved in heme utilization and adhesion
MNAGTRIDSSTLWDGNAGQIIGKVGSLTLQNGAQIRSQSGGVAVVSGQPLVGSGKGGSVTFTADDSILITGSNSAVSTSTFGNGDGGNVSLTAGNAVTIGNGGRVSADSGGTLAGQQFSGSGLAGNIEITAGHQITMTDGSVSTRAITSDGGNISIAITGSQLYLLNSQITTSVQSGVGTGGNITVGSADHPIEFVVLNGSQIRADAFGGPGGNINVFADTFLTSGSAVSASSALAAPGVINIQARFTNLSGNIAQLPENVVQAAALLRAACAARLSAGKSSSLVVAGREGVPLEPGGVMPSPLIAESSTDLAPSRAGGEGHDLEPVPATWRVSLRSKCSM